jgi:hypothetical protein
LRTRFLAAARERPTRSSSSSTRAVSTPCTIAEIASASRPVRPPCWADASSSTPTSRPGLASLRYSVSSTVAVPAFGGVSPQIMRKVVDFPAPLGPRNPVTVPGSQRNEMSSTATWRP